MRLFLPLTLLLGACVGSDRHAAAGPGGDSVRHDAARAMPAVAFRVPSRAGPLAVYALPSLAATPWGSGGRIAGARTALGADLNGRRLLYRDSAGAITSFDLVSMREKTVGPRGALATIGADGTLLAVDASGSVTESQSWGTREWPGSLGRGVRNVFAAPGGRIVSVREGGGDTLVMAARESGIALAASVPTATDRAATATADAFAFATDSGIVVYEDREMDAPWSVRLSGRPRAVVFSPSGHRLYVALAERSELAVIDRFARRERPAIALPGPAGALRPDPWGRVLLVRAADAAGGGETWVVALASSDVIGRLATGWASDLPTVSQDGVLLTREGETVIARDVRSLDSLGAVAGAADDLWFTGRWIPTSATAAARQRADSARTPARPREPAPERTAGPAPIDGFWVQVASSKNVEAARALVEELRSQRQPAQLLAPRQGDDPWRVVTGPYASREAADSAGRSLGRPYWVVDRGRDAPERE